MYSQVDNRIRDEGWALATATEVTREFVSEQLLPAAVESISMYHEIRRGEAYQAELVARGRNDFMVKYGSGLIGAVLLFETTSDWPRYQNAGFSRISTSMQGHRAQLTTETNNLQLEQDLYELRQALIDIGYRALKHFDIRTEWLDPALPDLKHRRHDIRIGLAHYPPGARLRGSDPETSMIGHRDETSGVNASLQLTPEEREWYLGLPKELSRITQAQGDRVFMDSRSTKTKNPNPFHALNNSTYSTHEDVSLLLSAPAAPAAPYLERLLVA